MDALSSHLPACSVRSHRCDDGRAFGGPADLTIDESEACTLLQDRAENTYLYDLLSCEAAIATDELDAVTVWDVKGFLLHKGETFEYQGGYIDGYLVS